MIIYNIFMIINFHICYCVLDILFHLNMLIHAYDLFIEFICLYLVSLNKLFIIFIFINTLIYLKCLNVSLLIKMIILNRIL